MQQVGYRRATMSEIHLESGQAYATIYQYFSNKEDIYLAWLERFMRNSMFELSDRVHTTASAGLGAHIDMSVRFALEQIVLHRLTLGRLINGLSLVSSRLVERIEDMNREWIQQMFGGPPATPEKAALLEKMQTATRAGNGYWLMLVLNTKREIDIEKESRNVSALIRALLSHA